MSNKSPSPERWPCIFKEKFVREEVDPRIQEAWKQKYGESAPFAYLRNTWRQRHCQELNPYFSDSCPFEKRQCGAAFLSAALESAEKGERPKGWFWIAARMYADHRNDRRPSRREDASQVPYRTNDPQGPGDQGGLRAGDAAGPEGHDREGGVHIQVDPNLHRSGNRPTRIGELLGQIDVRPHQGHPNDGEEGTK